MDKIKYLTLQGNNIFDIEPIADLVSLEILNLSCNPVTNLKPLENRGIAVDYHR